MNAIDMARTAYSIPQDATRTLRDIEYDAFARVTHRMKSASRGDSNAFPALVRALQENTQLWTIIAADVAEPTNGLPAPLRAQLFYLYEFTAQHSRKVLAGNATTDALVDINTCVMRGLRGEAVSE